MQYNLYLDDFRMPLDSFNYTNNKIYNIVNWKVVRNYDEFVEAILTNGLPERISYDHDLSYEDINKETGFTEKTGLDCARWLINYCMDNNLDVPVEIYIHSMNTVGALNIKSLFTTYYKVYPTDNDFYINDVYIKNGFYSYNYSRGFNMWNEDIY